MFLNPAIPMRLFWISLLLFGISACKVGDDSPPYLPYHKTLKIRQIGDQDEMIKNLYQDYTSSPTTQSQKDQNQIIDYLTDNRITAIKLPSGVYFKIYKYGNGDRYYQSRAFTARYTGYFMDGEVFDSNLDHAEPLQKRVGEMIQGWNETMLHLTRKAKVSMFIPSHLAYGENGIKGVIPPNTVLIFDVEF